MIEKNCKNFYCYYFFVFGFGCVLFFCCMVLIIYILLILVFGKSLMLLMRKLWWCYDVIEYEVSVVLVIYGVFIGWWVLVLVVR